MASAEARVAAGRAAELAEAAERVVDGVEAMRVAALKVALWEARAATRAARATPEVATRVAESTEALWVVGVVT